MPELPEVETVVRQLRPKITGRKIKSIIIIDRKLGLSTNYRKVKNKKIQSVLRRGKYIILQLADNLQLIIHLRMTGRLLWQNCRLQTDKHTRAIIRLSPKAYLLLDDLRRFATLGFFLPELGREPLWKGFNTSYLRAILINNRKSIKDLLLDQKKIAGIGNIYAAEILFASGIHPRRISYSLKPSEMLKLTKETKRILKLAIKHQGTTISDFADTNKEKGNFQNLIKVYDREGLPCPRCRNKISKIKQQGRSSYFCSRCQRRKK